MLPRLRSFMLLPSLGLVIACAADEASRKPVSTVQVFKSGAPFRGTNGIMFGPQGRLWVASVVTPMLAVLDPESGELLESYGPEDGVKGPDDVAFGPDGSVYWTDISYGEVGRRAPDGSVTVVGSPGPGVNPITFSDDGRLFVSQCFFGDKLFEIDPLGKEEPRLITDQLGPGCGLNGMDWGSDDFLYGPRWFAREVVKVDVDTGQFETVAADFGVPAAVKFDSRGRLHVLDSLRGEVVRLDGDERTIVGRVPASSADNLAFDAEDRLFVSSFGDGFIIEVLDADTNRTVSPGGLNMPGGLALLNDRLYVADFFALRGLDAETAGELYSARDIIGFSDLGSVMTVATSDANLVLTSWFDNTVKLWDPESDSLVAAFEGFGRPIHALAFDGDIVVTEYDTGSVIRFDPQAPETRTAIATGLEEPAGLAAAEGELYVSDRAAGAVFQVIHDGRLLTPAKKVAVELAGPEGMALGADGRLYVVESAAGRVTSIETETGARAVVAEGLELHVPAQGVFPSTMLFNGIALGENHAFVTGDVHNQIYRIER